MSSDDMMNTPINKRSLADEVAEHLRVAINAGTYKVDEQLPTEPELMKQFGVGRSSVREAIRILANSGLLRVQQGVGTFIEESTGITEPFHQRLKRADIQDIREVRQLLEMKIAEKAAINHTEADLIKIKKMLDKRNETAYTGSLHECVQADIDFHTSLAEAAGNPILTDLYQSFSMHVTGWLKSFSDTQEFKDTVQLHQELYEKIKARDSKKA